MSEVKFTKGPWVVYGDLPTDVVVAQNGECSLATLDCGCGGRSTQRANAHLIAAAPELYEALRMAVKDLNTAAHFLPDTGLALLETVKQAHAALAKARGEA